MTTKFNVGDKIRVNVSKSRAGNSINTGVPYTVEDVCDDGTCLGVRDKISGKYRSVDAKDVQPWVDAEPKYQRGDKVRVNTSVSRMGNAIDTSVPHVVKDVGRIGDVLGVKDSSGIYGYRSVHISDVQPWVDAKTDATVDDDVTLYTDKDGITREYREVKRKANVGELVKVVNAEAACSDYENGDIVCITQNSGGASGNGVSDGRHNCPWLYHTYNQYVTLVPTSIVHIDGKRYRTVERKANVGERVLVVKPWASGDSNIGVGSVLYCIEDDRWNTAPGKGISVGHTMRMSRRHLDGEGLYHAEYVVLRELHEQQTPSTQSSDEAPSSDDVVVHDEIVIHDGKRYRAVKRQARHGDLVRYGSGRTCIAYKSPDDVPDTHKGDWTWVSTANSCPCVVLEPLADESTSLPKVGDWVRSTTGRSQTGVPVPMNVDYRVKSVGWRDKFVNVESGTRDWWTLDAGTYRIVKTQEKTTPPTQFVGIHTMILEDRIKALETQNAALEKRVSTLEAKTAPTTTTTKLPEIPYEPISGHPSRWFADKAKTYTREEVVTLAQKDVETLLNTTVNVVPSVRGGNGWYDPALDDVNFHVDRKERVVTVTISAKRGSGFPTYVWARGTSHCAPDDCFNTWIGRAIALRRALGLDVPSYYTSAPKPTKVNVGDVVTWKKYGNNSYYITCVYSDIKYGFRNVATGQDFGALSYENLVDGDYAYISDDSHDFGGDSQ